MDLDRMLKMCRRHQWAIDDLDWDIEPRALSREDEIAVCQYFKDMSGIELLAGELFAVQRDQVDDPRLQEIFESFVEDEKRHSEVAQRLCDHYDVHGYQRYELNPHLERFSGPFVEAAHHIRQALFDPELQEVALYIIADQPGWGPKVFEALEQAVERMRDGQAVAPLDEFAWYLARNQWRVREMIELIREDPIPPYEALIPIAIDQARDYHC